MPISSPCLSFTAFSASSNRSFSVTGFNLDIFFKHGTPSITVNTACLRDTAEDAKRISHPLCRPIVNGCSVLSSYTVSSPAVAS